MMKKNQPLHPSIFALYFAIFVVLIFSFIYLLGAPVQVALLAVSIWSFTFGVLFLKLSYKELELSYVQGISKGMESVLILLAVGALIGTWISGGIVPSLVYYGLKIIHPSIFLFSALILCSITSIATGTSWGTVGTAGIALMGIGHGLGIHPPLVAGAILSGAYFGDKISPLSDSTILASSMSEVPLLDHIKFMLRQDIISYTITAIFFLVAGFVTSSQVETNMDSVSSLLLGIENHFHLSVFNFVPPVLVIGALMLRIPSLPSILFGATLGLLWSSFMQDNSLQDSLTSFYSGLQIDTGDDSLNRLLNRGGIKDMLESILVILFGLGLGGVLEKLGALKIFTLLAEKKIQGPTMLTFMTFVSGLLGNFFGCAMYVSLILTPRLLASSYDRLSVSRKNLSRNTEIGGTLTSVMIPWSDNGIYMASIFALSSLELIPFLWYTYVCMIVALLQARFQRP